MSFSGFNELLFIKVVLFNTLRETLSLEIICKTSKIKIVIVTLTYVIFNQITLS